MAWPAREVIFYGILGNPYIKSEDKPKRRDQVFKLGIDEVEKKEKVKAEKHTADDLKIFEQLNYSKNGTV